MKMGSISLVVAVATVTMLLQNEVVSAARKDQQLIETTCKNTPDYHLCIAVITADPSCRAAPLQDLALIVVAEIKKKTVEIIKEIEHLKKSGPKEMQPALKKCRSYYNAVQVGDIPVAEQATWGNPKFAETAMADAKIEAEMCEDAFLKVPNPSPFTKQNKYIADVAAVARGIIRNLL
ncbi:cell wall / vacuolar inhibitor of fructosidase 1-like [Salvia miltiorrhiza]|uniref:cell wall / vacuolar inhibitor of fructosidase 1-like n=1 Tax=Salvia miltiorrhiza TaxID=226208 RepID=UPI0025AD052C|nr:cell wall / vacuolar inhibitor of fructosidase 1-like [Salvia miltiorrhiza]